MMVEVLDINPENFSSYTTVHGLKFTVRGNHPIRRVIWTVVILFTSTCLVTEILLSIEKVLKQETTQNTVVEYKDSLKFPAVSLCNMNMMKKSKILGTDSQVFLDQMNTLFPNPQNQGFSNSSFHLKEAILQNGHALKDMIIRCTWRNERCTEKNFTMFYSLSRGLCYTFNSGQPGHPLLYAYGDGVETALTLGLNAEVNEYYGFYSYEGTGFKVLIHDQDDFPMMETKGLQLSAGFKMTYSMKKGKFIGLELASSNCRPKTWRPSATYSQSRCLVACKTKKFEQICNCTVFGSGKEPCNFVNQSVTACLQMFGKAYKRSQNCNCPSSCTREEYEGQSSFSTYPSPHFWDSFDMYKSQRQPNELPKYDRGMVSALNIFYSSSEETITKEILAYDRNDLFSDFGGFLGLFLGCSFLTFCEFVDLFFTWCRRKFQKDRVTAIGN